MKEIIASVLLIGGSLLQLVAAIGILKFPTLIIRLHASAKSSTLGIGLLLMGLAVYRWELSTFLLVILIIFFLFLSSPTVVYLFAQSDRQRVQDEKNVNP